MKPFAIIFLGLSLGGGAFAQNVTLSQLFAFTCNPTTPWFCADGAKPVALIQASDGNFYGATETRYANHSNTVHLTGGTIFKITPTGQLTSLYTFQQNTKTGYFDRARSLTRWQKAATDSSMARQVADPMLPALGCSSRSANPAPASK